MIEQFPDLFKSNTTKKDTEINIQLKPGHYPVKQKGRPIPLQFKEEAGKDLENKNKNGTLGESKTRTRRLFQMRCGNHG